jgi:hypothetical protein
MVRSPGDRHLHALALVTDRSATRIPATAGLCAGCRHAHLIETGRGSTFVLCERSRTDPRFPRYPRLPVVRCPGFEAIQDPTGVNG